MLHGQLPGCPGVDGTGCSSQLVFYPPKDKKVGHHGVGRYKCLGGYDSSEGYTTCRFKCTDGPARPSARRGSSSRPLRFARSWLRPRLR